jgi:hypothetical protein
MLERIAKMFITGLPTSLTKALAEAAAKASKNPGQFQKQFEDELLKQTIDLFKKLVEVDFKKIGEGLAKD